MPPQAQAQAWLETRLAGEEGPVTMQRDARGRPLLCTPRGCHDCNWSHSGEGLLVALGEHVAVGIDMERLRPRPRALAVAARYFTPGEADWLATQAAGDDRDLAFLRLWCAKEAVLKAHGHGLSFGLHRLRFEDAGGGLVLRDCDPALGLARDWHLRELVPSPGYIGALAWRPRVAG
ncbi:4'-phosphopantetheinyl transferase family protein [Lysobacter sp. A3-1-A15]|uniref:4'-phosphopantetheinyl transferase family protein n=1 Tax=Novilysobacter viscosus TaxID=3098602 RepID=UPI0039837E09